MPSSAERIKMKIKKLLSAALAASVMSCGLVSPSAAVITEDDYTSAELDSSSYDLYKYTRPFWEGNIVYNEIVFPIRDSDGTLPQFELMYDADQIVSVKNYSLKVTYTEGKDYILKDGNLVVLEGGSIPISNYGDIHVNSVPAGYGSDQISPYYPHAGNDGMWEYWTGGADLSNKSIAVTYVHNDTWKASVPTNQEANLPKTLDKLKNKQELSLVVIGDSVSTGAMGSGFLGIAPNADAYPEMTAKALGEKYSYDGIKLYNTAIGGTMSYFDSAKLDRTVIKYSPDLVIINFGMNDSSCDRVGISGTEFKSNLKMQINYIREKLPECEILLVSSLYGNRYTFPASRYEEHAAVLHTLASEMNGVGVADPQRIEKYLIEETGKDFLCFMADNMVHPNDFGMRLMSQTILEALSVSDIDAYRNALVDGLAEYADPDSRNELKKHELTALITETANTVGTLSDEWDINEVISAAYAEAEAIIKRCDSHVCTDTVVPPMCKNDGYTLTECIYCDFSYTHDPVPALGTEHIFDSGRQTVSPTYKSAGEITYTCDRCGYSKTEVAEVLGNAPALADKGMIHISNTYNYMESSLKPYTSGGAYIEFDACPISVEKFSGTPYIGLWFSGYTVTACYNFRSQQVEIGTGSLPSGTTKVIASAKYDWSSDGGEYEYNWKKFAVYIKDSLVNIYIDGELILSDKDSAYSATNEVALLYTTGEYYIDNFKVVTGNYDATVGTGGNVLGAWDFDTEASFTSFRSVWSNQYSTITRVIPNKKNVTTGMYKHEHSGSLLNTVPCGCSYGGYDEYFCDMCAKLYRTNYTEPLCETGHTLAGKAIGKYPTPSIDGYYTYTCESCDMTFTELIPAGTQMDSGILYGDVNGDGVINANDMIRLKNGVLGGNVELSESADVDGNGVVNAGDFAALSLLISGGGA